jgi:hypothetical protein
MFENCDVCGNVVVDGYVADCMVGSGKFRHVLTSVAVCLDCHDRYDWNNWPNIENVTRVEFKPDGKILDLIGDVN